MRVPPPGDPCADAEMARTRGELLDFLHQCGVSIHKVSDEETQLCLGENIIFVHLSPLIIGRQIRYICRALGLNSFDFYNRSHQKDLH